LVLPSRLLDGEAASTPRSNSGVRRAGFSPLQRTRRVRVSIWRRLGLLRTWPWPLLILY